MNGRIRWKTFAIFSSILILILVNFLLFFVVSADGSLPNLPERPKVKSNLFIRYEQIPFVQTSTTTQAVHTIHELDFEDAEIMFVENGMVQVETKDSKVAIVFRPDPEDLHNFKVGTIGSPVTLTCQKSLDSDCDFVSPYYLFAREKLVRAVAWKFRRLSQPIKALVHHGPADKDVPYKEGLRITFENGDRNVFLQLRAVNPKSLNRISMVKRDDFVNLFLPQSNPYKAIVNGGEFTIVAVGFHGH